jgi:hypothetical protein
MSIRVKEFNNQLENNDVFKSIFMKLLIEIRQLFNTDSLSILSSFNVDSCLY